MFGADSRRSHAVSIARTSVYTDSRLETRDSRFEIRAKSAIETVIEIETESKSKVEPEPKATTRELENYGVSLVSIENSPRG